MISGHTPARVSFARVSFARVSFLVAVIAIAATLLAGCVASTYTLVAPGRVVVKDAISIETPFAWNKSNPPMATGRMETWTLDGPNLNALTFFVGVADGEPLAARQPTGTPPPPPLPVFRGNMGQSQVAELFEATIVRTSGGTNFAYSSIKPATMGSLPGFTLEFTVTARDQVDRQGIALGAIKDAKLYLIVYTGTRLYHFGRDHNTIEALFASVKLV